MTALRCQHAGQMQAITIIRVILVTSGTGIFRAHDLPVTQSRVLKH